MQTSFIPKKNRRIAKNLQNIHGDGDVWLERLAKDPRGNDRSYFQSVNTNKCVWDEPPSGASRIITKSEIHLFPFWDLDKKTKGGELAEALKSLSRDA